MSSEDTKRERFEERKAARDRLLATPPGLNCYFYFGNFYCVACGWMIVCDEFVGLPLHLMNDSTYIPQPIINGESDQQRHCKECGAYLYGG